MSKPCTPGYEWMCATARSYECHCQCGGKNHGKFRYLMKERAASGPWSAAHAAQVLREAQEQRAARERAPRAG